MDTVLGYLSILCFIALIYLIYKLVKYFKLKDKKQKIDKEIDKIEQQENTLFNELLKTTVNNYVDIAKQYSESINKGFIYIEKHSLIETEIKNKILENKQDLVEGKFDFFNNEMPLYALSVTLYFLYDFDKKLLNNNTKNNIDIIYHSLKNSNFENRTDEELVLFLNKTFEFISNAKEQ